MFGIFCMPLPDNDTISTLSSFPSPHSWQPWHCVSPSLNMWALSVVRPVRSHTTPMMQHQILVTHNLRPKTTAVTPVKAESLHNYKESFLPPIFFNTCIFTYLWSWYAFQKSRTYLPVPYCTNVTDSCTYKNSTQINHRMARVLLEQ
jgi:hypothetical protein